MATFREYGYREYDEDLTPGAGGRSNLLFNGDGELTGHADFHALEREPETADTDSADVDPDLIAKVVAVVGVAVVLVGVGHAAVAAGRRLALYVRSKRAGAAGVEVVAEEPQLAGDTQDITSEGSEISEAVDSQDELLDEMDALLAKTTRAAASASQEPDLEDESSQALKRSRRPAKVMRRARR